MTLSTRCMPAACLAAWLAVAPVLTGAVPAGAAPPGAAAELTARDIRQTIDEAVLYLKSVQGPNGSVNDRDGYTALAALAMLAAGVHPQTDASLNKALDWLAARKPNNTYVRGIRANVWEYALRKAPHDKRLRELLKVDFDWLMKALGDREGWRYTLESRDWDNSCTQYGVLGVWAAQRAGFDPGQRFWKTMSKHFLACQNDDGGWGYIRGGSSANMATAGLASLFLVFDMHHGRTCYTRDNPRTFAEGEAAEVLAAIDRGLAWLGKAGGEDSGYYLYGIERTAVAGGRKYVGEKDWFGQGALACLRARRRDGSIYLGGHGGVVGNTAFGTMFLVYGGAPVAYSKLRHGDGADWNLNPRDLANLSRYLWSAYERPMNWQVVGIDDEPADLESPILFVSGSEALKLSAEAVGKLRQYVLAGGTILFEPSDRSEAFAESVESLVGLMFPPAEAPGWTLADLPDDHDVYTVLKQDWKHRPALRGCGDGTRTAIFLSDDYLSGTWQRNDTEADAFKLGMNLLFYATDLAELEGKFASRLPEGPPAEAHDGALTVARVIHGDGRRDWDLGHGVWPAVGAYFRHVTGRTIAERDPVRLGESRLSDIRVLHITGIEALTLNGRERAALKAFADGGGTVLVDAYAGSEAFAVSARGELEAAFGKLVPLNDDHPLASGAFAGGADLTRAGLKLPARKRLRAAGRPTRGQKLLVADRDGRPAVIFSALDISAAAAGVRPYRAAGYTEDAALQILSNLAAWLTAD